MKRILYISDLNEAAPLFHSQVVPHIKELRKYFNVKVLILQRGQSATPENEGELRYHSVKGDYFFQLAAILFLRQRRKIRSFLQDNIDFIYSRGIRGGILGALIKEELRSKKISLLNDMRGDPLDGMKDNVINRVVLRYSNQRIYKHSDILFFVSNYLREKVCHEYHFDLNRAFVYPTFVPDQKFEFDEKNRVDKRNELGYSDRDLVIVYSGNLAKWQNVETILSAFRQTSNKDLKLLVLTRDRDIQSLIKKYDLAENKVQIKNLGYAEIHKYYHAADFGILIRDNTDTNKSAAPTKFSEYVNSGLNLILNSIDADYIRVFREQGLKGILLEKKEDLLNCFNNINPTHVLRNVVKINTLSEVVKGQKQIIDQYTSKN